MTRKGEEWRKIGEFESVTNAAKQIEEIEGLERGSGIFFRILIETLGIADEREAFEHLEHTGRHTHNFYVVKRKRRNVH